MAKNKIIPLYVDQYSKEYLYPTIFSSLYFRNDPDI